MKYIVANWKANKTIKNVKEWLNEIRKTKIKVPKKVKVILCPSFLHLIIIKKELEAHPLSFNLELGAQNFSPYSAGTYTGEIAACMLSDLVEYVILGHSERRRYFKETDKEIKMKVIQALKHHIIPIVAFSKLNQVRLSVQGLKQEERKKVIFMYEPLKAISRQIGPIGVGRAAPLDQVVQMTKKIKKLFPKNKVLYGGSVKSHNIALYMTQPEIDGVVPGTASLNAREFIKLIKNAKTQA